MRTGLPASFVTAKDASFRRPRQLLVFKFPTAGAVYLSDQALGPADGLAQTYRPLVMEWGELADTVGDATTVDAGEIRQMSVTLWNGGATPFSDYFLAEFPENVEVELYQWFVGLGETGKVLIDRFVVADPISFDEASRLLQLDLVSLTVRYDQPCGELLTREAWPYALDADVGRGIPLAFGSCGPVPALKAKTSHTLRLRGSILAGTMVLTVYEDLDALAFPAAGTVLIDEEKIRYSGRTASTLTVIQRGYLSTAAEHLDQREVLTVITDHTFLLCAGPVAAITEVCIDGFPAPAAIYTVRPDLNPARIIFSESPWIKKYAEATRFLQMQFDGVAAGNTALQPYLAYDAADLATAAEIKQGNNTLALIQTTVNRHRGEIMKAYLAVEHWESGNFLSDRVKVSVSGIGDVGWLSRPNLADQIALDADVDIDHPHTHEIGGEHVHDFTQPVVNTQVIAKVSTYNPEHSHTTAEDVGTPEEVSYGGNLPFTQNTSGSYRSFSAVSGVAVAIYISLTCRDIATLSLLFGGYTFKTGINSPTISGWFALPSIAAAGSLMIGFTTSGVYANPAVTVTSLKLRFIRAAKINPIKTAVSTSVANTVGSVAQNGTVRSTGIVNVKNSDDIKALATLNRPVQITAQDNPSRTVVNLFDLTPQVNFNWTWFTGRTITLTYVNNAGEGRSVFILHAFFDIEYVPTEVVFSDAVTAAVTGLATLTRPDAAISHLLTTKGGAAAADLDAVSFAAMAARYTTLGYRLDGLIEATATVRAAIAAICYQCHSRLFPSGGKLKMALREGHPATKPAVRQLDADDLQLRSLAATRQPLAEIANRVQLFYQRDWTNNATDAAGYLQSVTKEDAKSIARFGLKTDPAAYCFDLIRSAPMAAAVVAFYIRTMAWPSTFYTFLAYLDQFDLEKEDVLGVTANFNSMAKMPMVVRAMHRIFGSGKNSQINLFRVVAENLSYLLTKISLADQVLLLDSLSMMISAIGEFADQVQLVDELLILLNLNQADAVILTDTFELIMEYHTELLELVTATDQVWGDMTCAQEDTVQTSEVLEFWSHYGFGAGGFGQVKFGGLTVWKQKNPDQIYAFMELLVAMFVVRQDQIEVADRLLFSSGFGGHLSSGFGRSTFGG